MESPLSQERKFLLLCARAELSKEIENEIAGIISQNPDWKEILYQGVTHRILNLMYYHLKNLKLLGKIENETRKIMETQYMVFTERNKAYYREIQTIYNELNAREIKVVLLKGNFLSANVYPETGTRTFNDADFLIDLKEADRILEILKELGYVQGEIDNNTGEIIEGTKKQKLLHRFATHELMECLKKTDNVFVPVFQVDLNFDVLWGGNCPYKVDTNELIKRAVPDEIMGNKVYVLDREDFLIQLSCHLYKEAVLIHWINDLRDLKLYKFADIFLYMEKYRSEINFSKLISTCKQYGIEKVVYYTFYHINLLFRDTIPGDVMKALEPEDKTYLNQYAAEKEKPVTWKYDFFTRLFETDRILELSGEDRYIEFIEAKARAGSH